MFEELLGDLPIEHFFSQYYGKVPFSLPEKATKFADMLGWEYLETLFKKGHADCWVAKDGVLHSSADAPPTFDEARHAFIKEGKSLLLRHAEYVDLSLASIAIGFESVFDKPVDVHIYATPAGQQGFGWHYDIEEVFAIQSLGQKEFIIRQNTVNPFPALGPLPSDLQFEKETSKVQFRCQLLAGDWLYMPAGWWHRAFAITDSFHLSIGVMAGPNDPKKVFNSRRA